MLPRGNLKLKWACLKDEMTKNGEMEKWRNGTKDIRAKVIRYNHSDKIIERINKRSQQTDKQMEISVE